MVTFYLSALLSRNFWNFYIFCICRFWFLLLSCCRCCLTHFFSIFHFFWLFLRYLSVILCTHKSNNKSKTELKIRLKLRFAFFLYFIFFNLVRVRVRYFHTLWSWSSARILDLQFCFEKQIYISIFYEKKEASSEQGYEKGSYNKKFPVIMWPSESHLNIFILVYFTSLLAFLI